jgi:hypothetical protein
MNTDKTPDASDPIFISYRQKDGTNITAELAWLLRAAGLPVWRDKDDLPPGDTETRLNQAIGEGISGGVLVTTPDLINSEVVKHVEAPLLLKLHASHPIFALAIANGVEKAPGTVDYSAPDQLLGLRPGALRGVDQQPATRNGLIALVQKLLWHRIAYQRDRVAADGGTFSLSLQTRNHPQVYDRTSSQIDIRVRASEHERLPSVAGLHDLQETIAFLPDAVTRSSARRLRIHGGAHLSVAFALGAALPSSRVGYMEVIDQQEASWSSDGEPRFASPPQLRVAAESSKTPYARKERPAVAIYLDLLPYRSDAAFERFIEERGENLAAWQHLTSANEGLLDHAAAGAIAADAAAHLRMLSNSHANAEVHLLLRCPFPLAVLTGRLTNTLRVVTYEWDDSDPVEGSNYRARYVPTLRVRASATKGAIEEVLLEAHT